MLAKVVGGALLVAIVAISAYVFLASTYWGFEFLLSSFWGIIPLLVLLLIIALVGAFFLLGGAIVLLVRAFQASKWWGLAFIFIPFASLVFIFTHWNESRKPFLVLLLGVGITYFGYLLVPRGSH